MNAFVRYYLKRHDYGIVLALCKSDISSKCLFCEKTIFFVFLIVKIKIE